MGQDTSLADCKKVRVWELGLSLLLAKLGKNGGRHIKSFPFSRTLVCLHIVSSCFLQNPLVQIRWFIITFTITDKRPPQSQTSPILGLTMNSKGFPWFSMAFHMFMKTSTRQVDAYYYLLRATQVLLLSATTFTVPDAGRWDPRSSVGLSEHPRIPRKPSKQPLKPTLNL